jgi:hypothetical protein
MQYTIKLTGAALDEWRPILGRDELPVLSPIPAKVKLRHLDGRIEEDAAYMVDIGKLTFKEIGLITTHLADKFKGENTADESYMKIWTQMLREGLPIRQSCCRLVPMIAGTHQ